MRVKLLKGQSLPPGYGIAYYDYTRDEAVALPLGLHWLAGFWALWLWPRLAGPLFQAARDAEVHLTGYRLGYEAGYQQGYEVGQAEAFAEIENQIEREFSHTKGVHHESFYLYSQQDQPGPG